LNFELCASRILNLSVVSYKFNIEQFLIQISKLNIQNSKKHIENGWQFAPSELSTIFFEKVLSFGFNVVDLW